MKLITDDLKIYELSRIWKEAAYNFAFWDKVDIDWDEEYKKALVRILKTKDAYDCVGSGRSPWKRGWKSSERMHNNSG